MRIISHALWSCVFAAGVLACGKSETKNLAPAASTLSSATPATTAKVFVIDPAKSGMEFMMDAELEKISGRAPGAAQGELFVDVKDLSQSSGLVKLDLDRLSIYKKVREDAASEFGEEAKNEKQNKDMRNWFQIGEDAPAGERDKFRWVEFKIDKVEASPNDVKSLSGAKRRVTASVSGDFRLHGRVTKKTIKAELEFSFDGDEPTAVEIKSTEPFDVGLEEHDVRPRKSFAELADATLEAMGKKVAKVAKISVTASARIKSPTQ
jgi:hypothetical protein